MQSDDLIPRRLLRKNGAVKLGPVEKQFRRFAYFPVPVRLDVCGLPTALSLTCNVPVLVPVCVGVNTTLIVHVASGARVEPQVVAEIPKSPVVEGEIPVSVADF